MPERFAPPHFLEVAEFLLEESEDSSDPGRWFEVQDARCRSAMSRAYYAVFLSLKERIEGARRGFELPQQEVHKKLRSALEDVLGKESVLLTKVKRLWLHRRKSDYDLGDGWPRHKALERADDADKAIELVRALEAGQLSDLAVHLKTQ